MGFIYLLECENLFYGLDSFTWLPACLVVDNPEVATAVGMGDEIDAVDDAFHSDSWTYLVPDGLLVANHLERYELTVKVKKIDEIGGDNFFVDELHAIE